MTVLLYGVAEAASPPPPGDGLEHRPLRTLSYDRLHAIVSDVEHAPSTDVGNRCAFEQIVEGLMDTDDILPARFGTTAPSDEDVLTMLISRRKELTETLKSVRGAVEFAVRAPEPPGNQAQLEHGRPAYVERLLARDRSIHALSTAARPLIRAMRNLGRSSAYLVERTGASEFKRRAEALGLAVTGPRPPYSFVNKPTHSEPMPRAGASALAQSSSRRDSRTSC